MRKLIFSFLLFCSIISFAYALTGSSQSYSVSMFGNGLSSGGANSANYNSVYLTETSGTTRNAESSGLMANIGFFNTGSYTSTVSITSYSINPQTAVIGSTISFSINALNADQVWAKITPPNSQEYTLSLINGQSVNHLPIPSVVGVYQVVFYAQSSTGAIASVVDSFELTAQSVSGNSGNSVGSGSGGGSGGSTIIERCTYNWDCTPWSVCSNGLQRRTCVNIGTCTGVESKPVEETSCSESLFDISLQLNSISAQSNSIKFHVDLNEKIGIEEIDVHVKYSIIDSENNEIFSQIETKAVKGQLSYEKIIDDFNLVDGNYILRVDLLYGNLQRAFAEQKFTLLDGKISGTITGLTTLTDTYQRIFYSIIIFLISFVILSVLIVRHIRNRRNASKALTISSLKGLDIYTDSGVKIGNVYDVMISDNKIYGLMMNVDKSVDIPYSKVLVRYEYVQNVKDVVIVSSRVLEPANHSDG